MIVLVLAMCPVCKYVACLQVHGNVPVALSAETVV